MAVLLLLLLALLLPVPARAQDRLKAMPGYGQFRKMSQASTNSLGLESLAATWKDEGKALEYRKEGRSYRYDLATGASAEVKKPAAETSPEPAGGGRRGRSGPGRGRQFTSAPSPDGKFKAVYHDHNLWLVAAGSTNETAVTTDGSEQTRVKYGSASWVYGEELDQTTAIWWQTNSAKLAFYRFDEKKVPDFHIELDQTKTLDRLEVEAYPTPGSPNPVADLFIYDLNGKKLVRADVRDGQPFGDAVLGHYVYHVSWSADGSELLFNRANRRQNITEFCACDPATGSCRVIVREEWPASWTENSPALRFLKDGRRFLWTSERTGWKNLYLYDLSGRLLATLTDHPFDVESILHLDEDHGWLYYTAHDGDNPLKLQLHRVGLNGKGEQRLTDPAYHHTVTVSPDGAHFLDVRQTHDMPPATWLMESSGRPVVELARTDLTRFKKRGLKTVELLKFKAADGETDLYGMLHFPSNFKPWRRYPLLVSVYAGPDTVGARETFTTPNLLTEFGLLVATFDSRSAGGRGKRMTDAIYLKLGGPEIDDQAAGVKALWSRRYVDRKRVGIFGTSYGGYASLMCLLRYPEVFQAASASSPPTAWSNYDTIYTERYMRLPAENKQGYGAGSAVNDAAQLKGRLLLYYATADNNVHPANSMQFIRALQQAGKSFEVQVGPDQGHSGVNRDRMMEFFIENLARQ